MDERPTEPGLLWFPLLAVPPVTTWAFVARTRHVMVNLI